jgi:hypothetical protein
MDSTGNITPQAPPDNTLQPGENNDVYLKRLLTSGQYGSTQDAINQFNQQVYGNQVNGPGDKGYGSSPAAYAGGSQIGMPGYYMTKGADGSWQTTNRPNSSSPSQAPMQNAIVPPYGYNSGGQNPSAVMQAVMQNLQQPQVPPTNGTQPTGSLQPQ